VNGLRVCFVCNEYPPGVHGGIGTMTQVLARALVRAGHQVRVVGVYPRSVAEPEEADDQGVRVVRLRRPTCHLGWLLARQRLFRQIAAWSRGGELDLVEVPDWQGWGATWRRLPVPLLVRLNGSATYFAAEMRQRVDRVVYFLENATLRRADFCCSASRYTAERTEQLFGLRRPADAILYNPVESLPVIESTPRFRARVVYSGTLTEKKGVVPLFQAWSRITQAFPDAELHVYGKDGRTADGRSMREYLAAQLDGPAKQSVRFFGHVARETLLAALQQARAAVFPSFAEAFAIAPLEAMACGCPTIYSQRGSGPELMRDGCDGLLVDPACPEEIAQAIGRLLADDSLAQQLGTAGRRRVDEDFSLAAALPRNEAFYRQCIDRFRRQTSPRRRRQNNRAPAPLLAERK
jgi:glycogen synthase